MSVAGTSTMTAVPMLGVGWPSFGDPSLIGWMIVAAYFAGALMCCRALHAARLGSRLSTIFPGPERRRRDRRNAYRASALFWALLVVLFIVLGLNKQVDLQTWLTDLGRRFAKAQGWYEIRRQVQAQFVLAVAVTGLVMLAVLLHLTRDLLPRHVLAMLGMMLLACFFVVRASSFHDIDAVFGRELLGVRVRSWLELSGIVCVAASAGLNARWALRTPADAQPTGATS